MQTLKRLLSFSGILIILTNCSNSKEPLTLYTQSDSPQVEFGLDEIFTSLNAEGIEYKLTDSEPASITIEIQSDNDQLEAEGFILQKKNGRIRIIGKDAAGAMYGGLELAEQIKIHGLDEVEEILQNPYMEMRGTKFNIPLDVRTPSYSDASDAAQNNIPEMWNFDFWKEYIDNLARYRYNFISFWSLHPFPSLVKVPKYPDIALDDVHRSTVEWKEFYHRHGTGLDAPEILNNYEVVKTIDIEEKIEFWQKVMHYANDRNIDIYFITWNIFTNGTFNQYGITDDIDNEVTKDYFRESIKAMFHTYPDLAGIGITTGENMHDATFQQKEDWAFDTYARAILGVAEEMPDRQFTFVHRQHQAETDAVEAKFKPLIDSNNIEFIYSFKYAKAHVFSATQQPYHREFEKEIGDLKTIWTLRNDDVYYFRWGAPDFVREFIQNIPHDISKGIYYGSDQWVWGREFTTRNAGTPREIEIVKHWYHWMMWGRLSYNPDLSDDRFIQILQTRFPEVNGQKLFTAWQEASMIYPVTTGFHWGSLDFKWYIEGCRSNPDQTDNETGFHDVNTFISQPVHPMSGYQRIPDYVSMVVNNEKNEQLLSPFDVSQQLHHHADTALNIISEMEPGNDKVLKTTLHDIKTIAFMGKYYAHKIAGSTFVALYRETKNKQYQEEAINELTAALEYWKNYTETALEQNINPIWTNRVGYVDWVKTIDWAEQDIEIAKIEE